MTEKYIEIWGLLSLIFAYLILSGSVPVTKPLSQFSPDRKIEFNCEYCPNFGSISKVPQA